MYLSDFDYLLPPEVIAHTPTEPRDTCKLLVLDKNSGIISHLIFRDLLDLLNENFVLVLNDTKVFPARLFGKKDTGGKFECLLLKQTNQSSYLSLVRGRVKLGQKIIFTKDFTAEITNKLPDGEVELSFSKKGVDLLEEIDKNGKSPLPPYIHSEDKEKDLREMYQTVYAKYQGSAAAPTAGLHFTKELLEKLKDKGVQIEYLTLHVGLGTFKPVTKQQIDDKKLHKENYILTEPVASRLNQAKQKDKKIIAVGTTTTRTLESLSNKKGELFAGEGETDIFIQPGYKFKFVDGLITNFHLPQTSLLMLVSALSNKEIILNAYNQAVNNKYKFFSFGDAMLIF
ncbi:tRNA preQ1(34) S-adenosylmethionine ribosyltransferase-isomerase QueA [Candidatus Collierbacteria bacterium RIFOXYD1_FULL_40_9]|uniref:S-adenosylmethionine:tRNA ribosyltransferase-isomerase n=1 Tax=Candidatus Collierbacteria bacterium RIFOXYD1_FULL_40_9 TaxID=1817731 RepID=A0A1F5FP49_9BACT|nr:MAG: tRNA preQ1(34) S-adenosylmethionine ribosyltransferase-isomerase QueA [Candidatus Collierbacteria bacterium RIFOXYD1_FULL_40_9]